MAGDVLPLPEGVDVNRADARFERGSLTAPLQKKTGDGKASRKFEIR